MGVLWGLYQGYIGIMENGSYYLGFGVQRIVAG